MKIIPVLELVSLSTSETVNDAKVQVQQIQSHSRFCHRKRENHGLMNSYIFSWRRISTPSRELKLSEGWHIPEGVKGVKTWNSLQASRNHLPFQSIPNNDLAVVAKELTVASPTGFCGWKNSLKDKMGNSRSKMRAHEDVIVNAGKRGRYLTGGDPPNKNIKKPRKGKVTWFPWGTFMAFF